MTSLRGAAAQDVPGRPRLQAGADTNDWEAYYDHGTEILRRRGRSREAQAAFYWASRLNPARAEPLYGRFVAFWMRDPRRILAYRNGDPDVRNAPDVRTADSLRHLALLRNPVVFQGLFAIALDEIPRSYWKDDPATLGYIAYANLEFARAARLWAAALRQNPKRNFWLRYDRALAFTGLGQYDSARTELEALIEHMTTAGPDSLLHAWASHAFIRYAIARLVAAQGDYATAKRLLQEALVADLGFHHAHVTLGEIALQQGNAAAAVVEYRRAVALNEADGFLRYEYGRALALAGDPTEAGSQFREAARLEPHYPDPYFGLGIACVRQGDGRCALAAFRDYLARAPRAAPTLATARQHIANLIAAGVDTTR